MGNSRVSYTEGTNSNAQVVEENSYYAFGLQHKGYGPAASGLGNAHAERYKYNGKELNEELGINWYDYGARNYDAAIGRWINVDPLAEVSRRWSPYAYCYNNPIRFVDPDGMRAADSNIFNQIDAFENDGREDWIKWSNNDGKKFVTYDSGIKSSSEAEAKGYTNVEEVFEASTATSDLGEMFDFRKGGIYSANGGRFKNVKEETFTTEGGTTINRNKSSTQQFASVFSELGDYSAYGAAASTSTGIGAPVGAVLGTASTILGGAGASLEVLDGIFNSETISLDNPEQVITKAATNIVIPRLVNKFGLNNVEKPLIDMLIMGGDKVIDKGRDNLVGPFYPNDDK